VRSLAPAPAGLRLPALAPTAGRRVTLSTGRVEHRKDLNGWSAPLPTIDGTIVSRSAAGLDRYGPDFSYAHHVLHKSFGVFFFASLFFGSLALIARIPPLQALFLKLVKPSGQGPSEAKMKQSWFKLQFIAECAGTVVKTEVSGGDPGYGET